MRSLLLKFIKNKIFLPPEVVSDTTKDICLLVVDKYRLRPDFKIEASFAGYIRYKILEILYAPQKVWEEQCGSLNTVLSGEGDGQGKSTEVGELSETLKFDYIFPVQASNPEEHFFKENTSTAIASVWTVFEDLVSSKKDTKLETYEAVIVSMSLTIYFRRDMFSVLRFNANNKKTDIFEEIYDTALLEIRNRLYE